MKEVWVPSEQDASILRDLVGREKQRRGNIQSRTHVTVNTDQTPSVYVTKTPDGGIPALTVHPTGQDVPGAAFCDIYRVLQDGNIPEKDQLWLLAFQEYVFNLSTSAVPEAEYKIVVQDRFGEWFVSEQAFDCAALQSITTNLDKTQVQLIGHDATGKCTWYNVGTCTAVSLVIDQTGIVGGTDNYILTVVSNKLEEISPVALGDSMGGLTGVF